MVAKPLNQIFKDILVEFGKLPCKLSILEERGDHVQLQLSFDVKWVHYEWWLPNKVPPVLYVAIDFERSRSKAAREKNLKDAKQLRGKVEAIAPTVGAQPYIGRRADGKIWATAALVFDLPGASSSDIAEKAARAMVYLVDSTLQEVKKMKM